MDLSRYLGLFVSDAREHLTGLEAESVRLERAADPGEQKSLLDSIFRHLHSLKSSSATMGLEPIAQLSHLAEGLAEALRHRTEPPTSEQVDLLLQTSDELRGLVALAADGHPLPARPLLAEKLARASEGLGKAAPVPRAVREPELQKPTFDGPITQVVVRINPRASAPAARAFLALRKLETVGPVLASEPTVELLREGKIPGHQVIVTLGGERALEDLRKAVARVPDVENVEPWVEQTKTPAPVSPTTFREEPTQVAPVEQQLRVNVELLDQLLELAGELVLAAGRLRDRLRAVPDAIREPLEEESDRLRVLVKQLNNRVLATRQTPVQLLADRLPRTVRDLSRRLGKPLTLSIERSDVTIDRGLADALVEPLLHALRNAADHGIESPEDRARAGKPPTGQITFAARRERERVVIELRDDGHGFDLARLRAKAVASGALTEAAAEALSDEAAHRLAFLPGVSTREASTDVSGRGVGMDAVSRAIEQLGGTVVLSSKPGVGSTVGFVLPATVSVVNLLLLSLGGEVFGLPMSRVLYAREEDLSARGGEGYSAKSIVVNGERVPAHPLGKLLGLPESYRVGPRPFVVVEGEGHRAAVGVDRLLGQEEVVLRPLGPPLERIRGLAGTAILGSGRPIFVLDVPRLVA